MFVVSGTVGVGLLEAACLRASIRNLQLQPTCFLAGSPSFGRITKCLADLKTG